MATTVKGTAAGASGATSTLTQGTVAAAASAAAKAATPASTSSGTPAGLSGGPVVAGGGFYTSTGAPSSAQTDAYQMLLNTFTTYGLQSLAPTILQYVQQGYDSDTISILLQQTDAYKKRFAANDQRIKNGLSALSPADYISMENQYQSIMRNAGLPSNFYDQPSDFTDLIANNVSSSEMSSRVQLAQQATENADPNYVNALSQMGLSQGDITAYYLDPDKALPLLQQQANTAAIGAAALSHGLSFDQSYANTLTQQGVTAAQANQGYGQISDEFTKLQGIASQYGLNYTYGQEEQAVFQPGTGQGQTAGQSASAYQSQLASWQRANVNGNVGGAQGGLARHGGGALS